MGQPTNSDVHADAPLTDFSLAYIMGNKTFVGGDVMPTHPVKHKSDQYWIFNKNDWLRDDAVKVRAEGQGAPRSGFTLSKDNYIAESWWTSVPMSELVRANADPGLPIDQACTQLVTQRMMIRRERLFATTFMATAVWGKEYTGGTDFTAWDDYTSDPEKNIDNAKNYVLRQTGFIPNCLVISYTVFQALKRHPLIVDRIKHTSSESVTLEIMARFFDVQKMFVTQAVYSTNAEGATGVQAYITGPHALLFYRDPNPALLSPTAATNFAWSGLTGMNDLGVRIDQFYDPDKKEDVVRGEFAFQMKVTGSDLGAFFLNAATDPA